MYKIRLFKRIRLKTEYIILLQASNLMKNNIPVDPNIIPGSYKYTWGIWQNYFLRDLYQEALPCHYFTELLDRDYVIYKGLPDFKPSYFIEELVKNNILQSQYKNSIVVVIGEDFNTDVLEQRLAEHLSDKVLVPLLREYDLDFTRIKLLDECLDPNWEEYLKHSKLNYNIKKHKYFDMQTIRFSINKYIKV